MTGIKVRSGGALVSVKRVRVRVSGALVTCKAVWVKSGGVLVKVWQDVTVVVTPSPAYAGAPGGTISVQVFVSGHTGAVSWAYVSGNATISINSSTSTSPTFSATPPAGLTRTAVWRVTDSVGGFYDLTVTIENTSSV